MQSHVCPKLTADCRQLKARRTSTKQVSGSTSKTWRMSRAHACLRSLAPGGAASRATPNRVSIVSTISSTVVTSVRLPAGFCRPLKSGPQYPGAFLAEVFDVEGQHVFFGKGQGLATGDLGDYRQHVALRVGVKGTQPAPLAVA